jgi:hypothetical protein
VVFVPQAALAKGSYYFVAIPYDNAGNEGQAAQAVFEINPDAPSISIAGISSGMTVNKPLLNLTGTIAPPEGQSVVSIDAIVNGNRIPLLPGTAFEAAIPLSEGLNFIQVRAETDIGNIGMTDVIAVTLKTTGPRIISITVG